MLEEKQISKEFTKLLSRFPEDISDAIAELHKKVSDHYKETGTMTTLRGFFSLKNNHFNLFLANDLEFFPEDFYKDKKNLPTLLSMFKDFLNKEGKDVQGFIMISEAWVKNIDLKEITPTEIDLDKAVSEYSDKLDCMVFTIDTKEYSYTSIYEKISSEDSFVISPDPIQEFFIDKENLEEKNSVGFNNFNFFN